MDTLAASATAIRQILGAVDTTKIMDLGADVKSGIDSLYAAIVEAESNLRRGLNALETESRNFQTRREELDQEKYDLSLLSFIIQQFGVRVSRCVSFLFVLFSCRLAVANSRLHSKWRRKVG